MDLGTIIFWPLDHAVIVAVIWVCLISTSIVFKVLFSASKWWIVAAVLSAPLWAAVTFGLFLLAMRRMH